MIILTGNPDIYSYAAENQYHADMYGKMGGILDSSAIISNAGVGESKWAKVYEWLFKDEDNTFFYYHEQINAHKNIISQVGSKSIDE